VCIWNRGGAVGVYMEPRGRWTEKVWEPLVYNILPPPPYIKINRQHTTDVIAFVIVPNVIAVVPSTLLQCFQQLNNNET
jgi:hypothetical protein